MSDKYTCNLDESYCLEDEYQDKDQPPVPQNKPDCLVLKLEEIEESTNEIDTTMYMLYDKRSHQYVIRGQRQVTARHNSCTFSFVCDYADELVDFICFILCDTCRVNKVLYNYDNLPNHSNNISFEFLKNHDHSDYELAGYENQHIDENDLLKTIRMLKYVFNTY